MASNKNVTGQQYGSTGSRGTSKPGVNMPANNTTNYPVKLGAGVKSKFASRQGAGQTGAQQSAGPKANLPANNTTNKAVALGTTKHAVGGVPHYLRNPNNSGKI